MYAPAVVADLDGDGSIEVVVITTNTSDTGAQVFVFASSGALYHPKNASDWFTNPASDYRGERLGWGQFIRWLDPNIEEAHYHRHTGDLPNVQDTMWLQWTASPPSLADLDGDEHAEVIGLPNAEMKEPYETQGYAVMAFDGAQDDGARSTRRHVGFETPAFTDREAAVETRLFRRGGQDLRFRGGRGRPEPERQPLAGVRHVRAAGEGRAARRAVRGRDAAVGHHAAEAGV